MSGLAAGSLEPQGPAARAIADLWWLMLWLGVAVFVVVAALLVLALVRRSSSADEGADPPGSRRWLLGGGVVMPVVVLLIVFGATIIAMRLVPSTVPRNALVVEITGHQWWYEVHYPEQGITVRNELHIPVGRPIALRLTSADVIHSFWVPALGGKMDMLPERTNTLVLQADQEGEHRARCAEFCGLQHANMVLVVVAEAPDRFSSWMAEQG